MGSSDLSLREKILVAMLRAGSGRLDPIAYEDIVVEAWRLFPDTFALRGYPQYPDGSNIHKPLYNALKSAGYVAACGMKQFALTEEGRRIATEAAGRADLPTTP